MGHEMGHYVLGHLPRLVLYNSALAAVAMFLLWWLGPRLLRRFGERWRARDVSDPAVAPLFAIVIVILGVLVTPLVNTIARTVEAEADAFGLEAAREPDGFATIAMLLSEYRKIEPGKWEERFFYDHPSGRARVRRAMEWKARHLGELPADQRLIVRPPALKPLR
jgi:STE24 endopeptidase